MKSKLLSIDGKKTKDITLPKIFTGVIREDVVQKVIEAKKRKQPYAPSPVAGNQQSDRGKIQHRRHVWKTHYGKGISRVPRKTMSRRGTQFTWVASGVPHVRGGPRTHPPKIISMINKKSINKKELSLAFSSALSATLDASYVKARYATLKDKEVKDVSFVVDSHFAKLKAKELAKSIKAVVGELYPLAIQKRAQRAGKGTMRGRRHKKNAGVLIVISEKEKIRSSVFDVVSAKELSVTDLAKGGLGRLTIYTEEAIKTLAGENKK